MKSKIIIQAKASFLILLLTVNIICWNCPMGFCTCGNFNSSENKSVTTEQRYMHKKNCCGKDLTQQQTNNAPKGQNNDACNHNIIKFSQIDKLCSIVFTGGNHIFTSLIPSFYTTNCLTASGVNINILNYCLRNYHPPIPDIRIAIRSFQI